MAEMLSNYLFESLKKHMLLNKIIAFSSDNCNTNFRCVLRKGTKNMFSILNINLKTNVYGVGCSAHMLHNAMQSSSNILPVDIEVIVNTISQFFIFLYIQYGLNT